MEIKQLLIFQPREMAGFGASGGPILLCQPLNMALDTQFSFQFLSRQK